MQMHSFPSMHFIYNFIDYFSCNRRLLLHVIIIMFLSQFSRGNSALCPICITHRFWYKSRVLLKHNQQTNRKNKSSVAVRHAQKVRWSANAMLQSENQSKQSNGGQTKETAKKTQSLWMITLPLLGARLSKAVGSSGLWAPVGEFVAL